MISRVRQEQNKNLNGGETLRIVSKKKKKLKRKNKIKIKANKEKTRGLVC